MKTPHRTIAIVLAMLWIPALVGSAFAQDQQELYDDIAEEMAEIRGLELLEPLDVEIKSREQLQEETREDLQTDYPAEERDVDQRVLVAFGLMEPDQDLGELYVNLLGEQVAGYYDPETNEMVVVGSSDGDELSAGDQVTFAHEAVHALQDQHFDLETYTEMRIEGTSDESLAVTALIEGDATIAQIDFLLGNLDLARDFLDEIGGSEISSEALDSAPPILAETLIFPYDQGQVFVQYLFDEGGWDLVNDAYEDPPTTTEQILHPEKYLDGEEGAAIDLPDISAALGDDWQTIDDDTMGEFQISVLLGDGDLSDDQVEAASEGWGGDAYTVSATDDDVVIAWETAWDSEEDAEEFSRALAVRESNRLDAEPEEENGRISIDADGAVIEVVLNGTTVTYVQAPDQDTLDTVITTLAGE